ncbi:MAG: hypothetical protein A2408_01795 [Candidatus Yonathbacteria bacterium RIFOXYC1_FULL_52_10]|uniref:Large ribosomal subunit protein uL15 n=1 Tax=Candidatus Yonathbacteria bacterium RIFOXYD1_FULL_52_36 TaxID=1802730 RepID=A0A1G2SIM9_9BACT|nr:MAG: hypothetical protein A2408_01795 [Candidatus Yonathbacteria bacterium RIFOXYC1_FULL_52_10]OHA84866.1 MAG: hypothetical protein A2591_00890 [Candidatus Yonathbacteria bacterium RIFOXYD1_FULL_52_36]
MQIHELKRKNPHKKEQRVGRGGKRGKTSGRGGKGQTARAGNKKRPELRDTIKKMPKLRGHGKNRARTVVATRVRPVSVTLGRIEALFDNGAQVTPDTLIMKGLIKTVKGRVPQVKVLGTEISKKVYIAGCLVSGGVREAVKKAGGAIVE